MITAHLNRCLCRAVFGLAGVLSFACPGVAQAGTDAPADEVRAIVAEMMADAQTRSSLVDSPGSVRYASGFRIEAENGASLRINGRIQFRFLSNIDADDDEAGFQNRRTRLSFRGTLPDELLSFRIQTDFGRTDGVFDVVDAWVQRDLGEGWSLRFGQWKPPFEREFWVSSRDVLAVDRSIVSHFFRVDRTQGIGLTYTGDRFRAFLMYNDGRSALNTDYTDPREAEFGFSGRAEYRFGDAGFRQYNTQSGMPGDESGVLLGGGAHYQQEGRITRPAGVDGTLDLFLYTVDASFEGDGWNAFTALVGRVTDGSNETVHDLGFTVQGGFYLCDEWEAYARYSRIMPDERPGDDDLDFDAITLGVNWYPMDGSRRLRVTFEGSYFPQTQADAASVVGQSTSRGLLLDNADDQFAVQVQVELFF
ncbi:MAG: porin [Planctomycetota bacterium]